MREKREANGRSKALDEVLRELEVQFGQYRPALDHGGIARGRVAGNRTLTVTGLMAIEGVEAPCKLNEHPAA